MITGFNTNVRYGGRIFHVQTEDSGRSNPHVISHVYHGGTILASQKRTYEDLLEAEDLDAEVRRLMEEQHRQMLQRLKTGDLDPVIEQRLDGNGSVTDPNAETGDAAVEEPPSESTAPLDEGEPEPARAFGAGIVSERPLDEVILEYLVDKARGRAARPGPGSRSRE